MKIIDFVMWTIVVGNFTAVGFGVGALMMGHIELNRYMACLLILGCLPSAIALTQKLIEDANKRRKCRKPDNSRGKG